MSKKKMALTAQQEAFVVALFEQKDALIAIRDRFKPRYLFEVWKAAAATKKAQLKANQITAQQYNDWLAANPEPAMGD